MKNLKFKFVEIKSHFNILLYLTVIGFLFFSCLSCENKLEPPRTDLNSEEIPDQESWEPTVVFSDSGTVKAILRAGHIAVFNKKGYTLVDSNAVVDFYRDGQIVSTLSGKKGIVIDSTKDIEMFDSVVVVNKEGSVLKTEKLFWNNKTQRVSTDAFVNIKTPNEEIEGNGFESDQNLKNYIIYEVTGTF